MTILRTTILTLPILLATTAAFADSEDKKKTEAEPQAPVEEEVTVVEIQTPAEPQAPQPAPAPVVGTTQTTAVITQTRDVAEPQAAARAGSPVGDKWQIEPLVGYGTGNFNFGVGGRAGYTFETPVYIGATFMWHNGETNDSFNGAVGNTETKNSYYYPGLEAGYDIGLGQEGRVLIRPYAGAGILFNRERVSVNGASVQDTTNAGLIYPGITARYNVPSTPVFVGADTRLLVPLEARPVSYQAFFTTGLSM